MRIFLLILGLLLSPALAGKRPVKFKQLTIEGVRPGSLDHEAQRAFRRGGPPTKERGPMHEWGRAPATRGYWATPDTHHVWDVYGPNLACNGKPFLREGATPEQVKAALGQSDRTEEIKGLSKLEFWFWDERQALSVFFKAGRAVRYDLEDHELMNPNRT